MEDGREIVALNMDDCGTGWDGERRNRLEGKALVAGRPSLSFLAGHCQRPFRGGR